MTIAQDFPDFVTLGEPIRAHGLSLFPLFRIEAGRAEWSTLGQALDAGSAQVLEAEHAEGPWYRQLRVVNRGALPLLVRDSDLLHGGAQDRVADRPVWVPAGQDRVVPVSCVEQNRSSFRGRVDFQMAASQASPAFRHRRARSCADQGATWAFVAESRRGAGLADVAGSMLEVTRSRAARAAEMGRDFRLPAEACGVVVARRRGEEARVELVEWCSQPAAFQSAWAGLLASVLEDSVPGDPAPRISRTEVRRVLGRFRTARRRDHRRDDACVEGLEHKGLLGWATQVDDELVHVTATLA